MYLLVISILKLLMQVLVYTLFHTMTAMAIVSMTPMGMGCAMSWKSRVA
jgi:hypothetical protein